MHTFCCGLPGSHDVRNARIVAQHLNTTHHEVLFTEEEAVAALSTVIAHLESFDTQLPVAVPWNT